MEPENKDRPLNIEGAPPPTQTDESTVLNSTNPMTQPEPHNSLPIKDQSRIPGRLILVIIAVAIIVAGATLAWFIFFNDNDKSDENAAQSTEQIATHLSPSSTIFNYIDGAEEIETADFVIVGGETEGHQVIPSMSGSIGREASNSRLGMKVNLDEDLVNREIEALKKKKGYQSLGGSDFPADHNFQVDMAGVLSTLGILPQIDEEILKIQLGGSIPPMCKSVVSEFNSIADKKIAGLSPEYQASGQDETTWTIDAVALAKEQREISPRVNSECEDLLGDEDDYEEKFRLRLKTSKQTDGVKFSLHFDPGVYTGPVENVIFEATLKKINASESLGPFNGPSLFQPMNTGHFIMAIDRCKGLPLTASTFAASWSYDSPTSENYSGPNLFDSAYFCKSKEAEEAGYNPSTL